MSGGGGGPLLDVQRSFQSILRHDFSETSLVAEPELAAGSDVDFLRWIPISIDDGAGGTSVLAADDLDRLDEFEFRHGRGLFEQLFIRQIAQAEVLPPRHLLLAIVPVEEIGKQIARLRVVAAGGPLLWNAVEQSRP